jgi:cell pole-organizing protein PopZ
MSEPNEISNHSGPGSAAEPSMEEILASIRRILKDDEGVEGVEDDDDLLVLDSSMVTPPADISTASALPEPPPPASPLHDVPPFASTPTLENGAQYYDQYGAPIGHPLAAPPAPHTTMESPHALVSESASSMVASTIGSLVRNISSERAAAVSRGGLTIEDIVREEIKPILKSWLDSHLPTLVERIVRSEIERLVDRTQI